MRRRDLITSWPSSGTGGPRPPSPGPRPLRPRAHNTASGPVSARRWPPAAPLASAWSPTAASAARCVPSSWEPPATRPPSATATVASTATTAQTPRDVVGVGCVLDGVRYRNGQSFQPNCKYNCTCLNGAVGCVPLCLGSRPPLVWCPQPRRVRLAGRCCDQWVCDDGKKLRRASPRHVPAPAYEGDGGLWQHNCMPHTSPWSLCSRSCGMGISTRISNANERCQLTTESRLCNLRPCQGGIARHIKPGKKCLAVHRPEEPRNFTISGCVSRDTYRPKFCGVCTDGRCCTPYKSKTINVSFVCPDGPGFSWKVMWINACFCHLSCKNPNDIFADLEHYHDYSEIAD
ncbi:CCN family member 4 isoform X2 [Tachyglossus aculeatus]|uniref:CCN family member 4 isoform X2 n=1 Tax=Tachyglossus aculeatus TaxID=9261 RepID=UPI0018F2B9FF|nr:CCN family member 4 isoform X2 [Tachyglossus aculeatus]